MQDLLTLWNGSGDSFNLQPRMFAQIITAQGEMETRSERQQTNTKALTAFSHEMNNVNKVDKPSPHFWPVISKTEEDYKLLYCFSCLYSMDIICIFWDQTNL